MERQGDDADAPSGLIITRRGLLRGLGLVLLESQLSACEVVAPLVKSRSFDVIRPDDRLWLHFDLFNLELDPSAPAGEPRLVRKSKAAAYVVVTFPAQAQAEQALATSETKPEDNEQAPLLKDGIQARLAGSSRLAFRVPDGVSSIPYTLEALLDWQTLEPSLVPVTRGPSGFDGAPTIRNPHATETALELPWWLVLSPEPDGRWAHATSPVTHRGRTELWHTRLGVAGENGTDESRSSGVRAVWARDPMTPAWLGDQSLLPRQDESPFRMSSHAANRIDAVRNTSDWSQVPTMFRFAGPASYYTPRPFDVRRLHLTALGANADLDGAWNPPGSFGTLVAWAQRMTGGRDATVRVVNRAFLFPYGHKCVEVVLTERKLRSDRGTRAAYLLQRKFLVITERRRTYQGAVGLPLDGRAFPFRAVEIVTRQTQDLLSRKTLPAENDPNAPAFQPMADAQASEPLMVDCVGTDWAGRVTAFRSPFVVVYDAGGIASDPAKMGPIAAAFGNLAPERRTARVGGAKVAFAAEDAPDDTSLELHDFVLGASKTVEGVQQTVLAAAGQIAGFPSMVSALVAKPGLQALAGAADLTSRLEFLDEYLKDGFGGSNPGGAFLKYAAPKLLDAATDATGGLITPNQALTAVTRALGPVGGKITDIVNDRYDPKEIFDQAGKLLGGVPLKEILTLVEGVKSRAEEALKWVEQRRPTEVVASFKFKPKKLQADGAGIFNPSNETIAIFEGEARQSLKNPNERSARVSGELTNFVLKLIGGGAAAFLELDVAAVRFRAGTGKKTELDVQLRKVTFTGALSFVEALRPFLDALGKGPASLPIPKGIEVTAGLQIPKVQLGVFQLANLGFDARLVVPFTGDPVRFRFRFATKENPFTLSVSIFGGTGYFALGVGGDGVELVEIALEFGGMLALDVGVASGSIKAVAGIYIKLEKQGGGDRVELSGYLKLHGQLQVLGIVSVSILLDLSFQYLRKPGPPALEIVTGRAKCELKVTIVFFTISVGFEVEKSFGGNPADPTVADQFTLPDWQEYAAAFA